MAEETTVLMLLPDIEGTSTFVGFDPEKGENADHTGWIPIDACSFKFARKDTVSDSADDDETEGQPPETTVDPITITRTSDYTSAEILIWLSNAGNDEAKKDVVLIDFCHASGKYYQRYELTGVELVAGQLAYSHPNEAKETLTFTYDEITVFQRPLNAVGEVDVEAEQVSHYAVFETDSV